MQTITPDWRHASTHGIPCAFSLSTQRYQQPYPSRQLP